MQEPIRPSVLFVDDEPNLLSGLRRMLRGSTPGWELLFASSGAEALAVLAERRVDAVVSDMRMPGMNGAELLAAVQDRVPGAARIILSGQAEREAVVGAAGCAQQFLAKPCDPEVLVAAVTRALGVRRMLADQAMGDVIGGISSLPKPPEIYDEMVAITSSPNFRLADVSRVVLSSVATSAEVLKLVNTAFFGIPRRVESVETAVSLLGVDNIQALVLASALFRPGTRLPEGIDAEQLQRQGLLRSALVKRLGVAEGLRPPDTNMVMLAAVLRDVGLLALAATMPERVAVLLDGAPPADAPGPEGSQRPEGSQSPEGSADPERSERPDGRETPAARAAREIEVLGCSVPQAGAHLLALWGFPDLVVHALACQPLAADDVAAGTAEHVLDAAHRRAVHPDVPLQAVPDGFLDAERAARWNAACDRVLAAAQDATGPGAAA